MLTAAGLSGCFFADPDGRGIDVLNDTGRTLWLDQPADRGSRRVELEPHAWRKLYIGECRTGRVEAQTRSGRAVATLDQRWCPGQDWIITPGGEFVPPRTPWRSTPGCAGRPPAGTNAA